MLNEPQSGSKPVEMFLDSDFYSRASRRLTFVGQGEIFLPLSGRIFTVPCVHVQQAPGMKRMQDGSLVSCFHYQL